MSLKRLLKKDYHVGLLVTDPSTFYCLELLLDVRHDQAVTFDVSDTNTYLVGEMSNRNVVICYFNMKNHSESNFEIMERVMQNFRLAFSQIESFVSVGYCSGMPSKNYDIRRGDILVAGCAKIDQDGITATRRPLDEKWFKAHQTAYVPKDIQVIFSSYRKTIENKNDTMKRITARPDKDVLTEDGKEVIRTPRTGLGIAIFYGEIADIYLTGETARKQWTQKWDFLLGCDPLAKGIMKVYPKCLFIRSISDYGTHPRDESWHKECAKNSSAYAKYLIGFLDVPINASPSAPLTTPVASAPPLEKEQEKKEPEKDKKPPEFNIEPILDVIYMMINRQVTDMENTIKAGKKPDPIHVTHILENLPPGVSDRISKALTADKYTVKITADKAHNVEILEIS